MLPSGSCDLQLQQRLSSTSNKLSEFCQRWHIRELALFSLILRDDFYAKSDIDMLASFKPDAKISLLDLVNMQYELESLCHLKVDLLTKKSVKISSSWIRPKEILNTARFIYESGSNASPTPVDFGWLHR
ncbi:MAG: DNA polymerase subunit beta [Synechococcaceae cyanobacterium SM2_3_1]|nr:DNA polymerase subunit beta [Synechococcaceae cyanobacterium SM2_3_1]